MFSHIEGKGLAVEIIAHLRAEREALVARIEQIDNMLRQYEEWGREAQRLLSLTMPTPTAATQNLAASGALPTSPTVNDVSHRDSPHAIDVSARYIPASMTQSAKTPVPEFEAAVMDLLRKAVEPMDRVALYEALNAQGIVIGNGGRDKDLNTLSARVYRMAQDPKNRISSERGQGYRLIVDDQAEDPPSEDAVTHEDDDDIFS